VGIFFEIVEKITVFEEELLKVSLLDGTEIVVEVE
jgi:hypothetical protein